MIYGSVCSGIEAATVAWHHLGWKPAFFAEIDPFCCALLNEHYPEVPNIGDFTQADPARLPAIDLLVGGTPCQAFSVAGARAGLEDPRGNLTLQFLGLVRELRPAWVVWENVPGVLSIDHGRTFAAILDTLAKLGYGFAYRILDAQFVGGCPLHLDSPPVGGPVPQRRRRVFVVARLGDWQSPAQVLFEPQSLLGYPTPGGAERKEVAGTLGVGFGSRGTSNPDRVTFIPDTAYCLNAGGTNRIDGESETFIAHSLRADGFDASEDGTGRGTPLVVAPICFSAKDNGRDAIDDQAPTLRAMNHVDGNANGGGQLAVAVNLRGREGGNTAELGTEIHPSIRTGGGGPDKPHVLTTTHAIPEETNTGKVLRALRREIGEKAISEWGLGVLAAVRSAQVLQPSLLREGTQAAQDEPRLDDGALPREKAVPTGAMHPLLEAACFGCSPQGWQPSEQFADELRAALSLVPHAPSPASRLLHGLWEATEGIGVLREALSALQEAWRPAPIQTQPAHPTSAVRRLTPREAEALMNLPRDYTLIAAYRKPHALDLAEYYHRTERGRLVTEVRKGKLYATPDGPRYRAIGNSMAVTVMRWIGLRIQEVSQWPT